MRKNDIYVIIALIIVAFGVFLLNLRQKKEGNIAIIYFDGEVYETVSLKEDKTVKINDTNVVRVEKGKIFMESANCPDQVCVHQKPLDSEGRDIVCLPNKVTIRVLSDEKEVDAVVR